MPEQLSTTAAEWQVEVPESPVRARVEKWLVTPQAKNVQEGVTGRRNLWEEVRKRRSGLRQGWLYQIRSNVLGLK